MLIRGSDTQMKIIEVSMRGSTWHVWCLRFVRGGLDMVPQVCKGGHRCGALGLREGWGEAYVDLNVQIYIYIFDEDDCVLNL